MKKKKSKNRAASSLEQENQPPNDGAKIAWHPAFIEAIQLELDEYKDVLEFYPEYQLTAEPLKIDCVIIKKNKDVEIKKNFAAVFRKWNLIEYKSPEDYVSIDDFYKVYGYACLYTHLNSISITDLTITFIKSRHPKKLLSHLKKTRNYTVAKTDTGIYTVIGDILPIQIISEISDIICYPNKNNIRVDSVKSTGTTT